LVEALARQPFVQVRDMWRVMTGIGPQERILLEAGVFLISGTR